jgi:HAD superfamily hydrolase (TIGR01549 family)
MRLAAVIFDVDGTLADNLEHAARAYRKSFEHFTGRTWTSAELFALFGPNCEGICRKAVPERWAEAVEMFYRELDASYDGAAAAIPGLEGLLGELRSRGCRLAAVSGGSPRSLEITLKHTGLGTFFERVVGGSADRAHKAESIREVLADFGVAPGDAAYVGDSSYDMRAAREAGVLAIRAAWSRSATLFVEKPGEPAPAHTFRDVAAFRRGVGGWD